MAAALIVLLALAKAAPADGPLRTTPVVTPSSAAARTAPTPVRPPEDHYGYVAWCYGALETYLGLYDQVMPDVTRIERAFPSPRGAAEDLKIYPQMRAQARKDLVVYRDAIVAAEKASPRPIAPYGAQAMRQGRAVWAATAQMKTTEVARQWMGWSPPAKCDQTAATLTVKSTVLSQALIFNAKSVPERSAAAAPSAVPTSAATVKAVKLRALTPDSEAPKTIAAPKPAAQAPPAPRKPAPSAPDTVPKPLPAGAYVMDTVGDKGCPGRLDASMRNGRLTMICLP